MSLYYCRNIVYFVTFIETFVLMDVPEDIMAMTVVTYVVYVLYAVMKSECMHTFGVRTVMGS